MNESTERERTVHTDPHGHGVPSVHGVPAVHTVHDVAANADLLHDAARAIGASPNVLAIMPLVQARRLLRNAAVIHRHRRDLAAKHLAACEVLDDLLCDASPSAETVRQVLRRVKIADAGGVRHED